MTRKSWVQDPVTLKLIPKDEYIPRGPSGPFVMGELKPYRSMVTGEMIEGRAQHRAHLRQHGVIEVGNEKLPPPKQPTINRDEIRRDLAQIMSAKGY